MRRLALLASLLAVVTSTGTAAGSVDRTPRSVVEQALLKVRPAPDFSGIEHDGGNRVRVIMTLADPPLAAATYARSFAGLGVKRKLNMYTAFSRSYVSTLEAEQTRAIARVHDLIPSAAVSRRYQILVNGFAVSVPYSRLPALVNSGIATRVYPSLSYRLDLNRGPSVVGAPQFSSLTGARGDGVKVAVVDDGVDYEHPFLDPKGFSYPPGFPKGPGGTSPKVIVARGFAGPGANSSPLDRDQSFHGTFVAGVIAGVKTDVPAGRPGSCAESSGGCHPAVKDVEGVAPRAYIGNYRVFNVPQPAPFSGCCSANSPEIVAAFEAAVRDGMDIINFSGGGPQADPRTDILIPAVANVVRAGVVPVISAGNDRDFFGLGTAGSPATAPDAISVGAVANAHMFGPSLQVVSPSGLPRMPFVPTDTVTPSWISANQRLVDVGSIVGISRELCGAAPGGSLTGAIALVSRGGCPYGTKAANARAAGAIGIVIAENRPGDPTFAYITALSGGTISDLDGSRIRGAARGSGGAVTVRFTRDVTEVPTTWAGVPTSFTSSGLTPFGHALKPDVTAPGAQILSSTLPEFAGDQFAVLDGTSFSAPHVAGVAALLTQRHPSWTAQQMKSALMSTAGPAWGDTSLTEEASVLVEGAGLVNAGAADKPLIFTDPQSLSFGYLVAGGGANSKSISVGLADAGGGQGTWVAEVRPQVASAGATVEAAPVTLAPGGAAVMQFTARASAGAVQGDNFGFVVLRRGSDTRRIPYAFSVSRSSLTSAPVTPLKTLQTGDTRTGDDRAHAYRWPTSPFSILGIFGVDPSVNDDGKEKVYSLTITKQAVNAGVVVVKPTPKLGASITALLSSNQPIHPWFMGSLDENDVLGYAGIPVNVNESLPDYLYSLGASGGVFLPPGKYYVSVDSGRDLFTGRPLAGKYTLRSWVNDVRPPTVKVLTTKLSTGRPTIVAKVTDAKSGVDPMSLQLFFGPTGHQESVRATLFDPNTGIAAFSIPREATALFEGPQFMTVAASDFQESKNISESANPLPNTRIQGLRAQAVKGPTVSWVTPETGRCVSARQRLLVVANDNVQISSVGFFDGRRQIGRVQKNVARLYEMTWSTKGKRRGPHVLTAVASDVRGREAQATQPIRVCK